MKRDKKVSRVWLITGVSSGLGLAFSVAALAAGHTVIGTVRKESDRAGFEKLGDGRAHAVVLDVSDFAAIEPTVAQVMQTVGPIDVLVNNAGYGHEGTLEESPLDELRRQFDVNVFGAVAMIKAVLPQMRERRTGHIVNITSMAGIAALPGIAYYSGSKFALEGITESLAQEVAPFGVRVIAMARAHSEPIGPDAPWSAPIATSPTTTPRSIPSGTRARQRAAYRPAPPTRPRK